MLTKGRLKRKKRIRGKLEGTSDRPRLSVFRSNKFIYAQIIDDSKGTTLVSSKGADASVVGDTLAKEALKNKIKTVVFDRNGFIYHGRIKALADAARSGGLTF